MSKLVIAIDGPAGAGKSTVAKAVAKELGLQFLDTGAMYRALALKISRLGLTTDDFVKAAEIGSSTTIAFGEGEPQRVLLDGEDVTDEIRTPEIGELASALSVHSPIRKLLAQQQRQIVQAGGVTLEGRDTTTVTAFDAPLRVFLTAALAVRAKRRHDELVSKGLEVTLEEIVSQIADRDHRDTTREDSPLHLAEGVVLIESDLMSADQVVEKIKELATNLR